MGVMYKLLKHRYHQQLHNNSNNNNFNNNNNTYYYNYNGNNSSDNAIAIVEQHQHEQQLPAQRHRQRQQHEQQQQHPYVGSGSSYTKDLIKSKLRTREKLRRTITLEGNIVEQPLPPPPPFACEALGASAMSVAPAPPVPAVELDMEMEMTTTTTAATASASASDAGVKEFTAEHILQLCKFLAERAKKNKHLCKAQQKHQLAHQHQQLQQPVTSVATASMAMHETLRFTQAPLATPDAVEAQGFVTTSAPMTMTTTASSSSGTGSHIMSVLAEHATNAITSTAATPPKCTTPKFAYTTKSNSKTSTPTPTLQSSSPSPPLSPPAPCQLSDGGKRDILLLKIRRQIFERKRQRQLAAHVQQRLSVVWRPW